MNFRQAVLSASVALIAGLSFQASAAETSSTFQVTASVASSCVIVGAANIDLGTYDPVNQHQFMDLSVENSGVEVRCNGGTQATVRLDEGLNKDLSNNSSCNWPQRRLVSEKGDFLPYQLHRYSEDVGGYLMFGCASQTEATLQFTSLENKSIQVRAAVSPSQNAKVGSYSDTITVSVSF